MDMDFYNTVKDRYKFLEISYENKKSQRDTAIKRVEELKKESDILSKTEKVLKQLIDKLAKEDLSRMDKLITYGLKTVFPDRDIRFESKIEERGKKIKINLQTIYNGNIVDPQSKSSIQVIESFLLRILCLIKLKKARFIMMDETFSAVDYGYIDNVCQLVTELASKLNIDILLVTHNPNIGDYVNHSYKLTHKNNLTGIEKIK